ncbi:hypothetical protein DN412_30995 [Cupriavidus lacunae]|uniref:Uncharacterized protein n=1 Tax=Cupriavidus lacunae TaxID=2666307 RepID=A0A370NLN9_9BURK|nr:hypothetical protein DN412_30995 [Cupriavidus lacunae]
MSTDRMSLRGLLAKWVGVDADTLARVTRVRPPRQCTACVQVDVARASGNLSLFFFRHADGSWCVFPPSTPGH